MLWINFPVCFCLIPALCTELDFHGMLCLFGFSDHSSSHNCQRQQKERRGSFCHPVCYQRIHQRSQGGDQTGAQWAPAVQEEDHPVHWRNSPLQQITAGGVTGQEVLRLSLAFACVMYLFLDVCSHLVFILSICVIMLNSIIPFISAKFLGSISYCWCAACWCLVFAVCVRL